MKAFKWSQMQTLHILGMEQKELHKGAQTYPLEINQS